MASVHSDHSEGFRFNSCVYRKWTDPCLNNNLTFPLTLSLICQSQFLDRALLGKKKKKTNGVVRVKLLCAKISTLLALPAPAESVCV